MVDGTHQMLTDAGVYAEAIRARNSMGIDKFVDSLRVPANKDRLHGNIFAASLVYVIEGKPKRRKIQ
jgi:hypothetical protein